MKHVSVRKIITAGGLVITLIAFLLFTSPHHLPLILIMVPFILFFLLLFYAFYQIGGGSVNKHRRQRLIRAGLLAFIPVLLLVLQTIHQLTGKDLLITGGLVLLTSYYLNKANFL